MMTRIVSKKKSLRLLQVEKRKDKEKGMEQIKKTKAKEGLLGLTLRILTKETKLS